MHYSHGTPRTNATYRTHSHTRVSSPPPVDHRFPPGGVSEEWSEEASGVVPPVDRGGVVGCPEGGARQSDLDGAMASNFMVTDSKVT